MKYDGGPAFARPGAGWQTDSGTADWNLEQAGMSLRDYFAAKAMFSLVATRPEQPMPESAEEFKKQLGVMATLSYQIADVMLEARSAL